MSEILKFARQLDQIVRQFGSDSIYPDDATQHDPAFNAVITKEAKAIDGHKNHVIVRPEGGNSPAGELGV